VNCQKEAGIKWPNAANGWGYRKSIPLLTGVGAVEGVMPLLKIFDISALKSSDLGAF